MYISIPTLHLTTTIRSITFSKQGPLNNRHCAERNIYEKKKKKKKEKKKKQYVSFAAWHLKKPFPADNPQQGTPDAEIKVPFC